MAAIVELTLGGQFGQIIKKIRDPGLDICHLDLSHTRSIQNGASISCEMHLTAGCCVAAFAIVLSDICGSSNAFAKKRIYKRGFPNTG